MYLDFLISFVFLVIRVCLAFLFLGGFISVLIFWSNISVLSP